MRSEMFKIIVERPRWSASHAASPKLKRTKDDTLKHIGHKRHAYEGAPYTKSLKDQALLAASLPPVNRALMGGVK